MDMGGVVKVEVDISPEVLQPSAMNYFVKLEPKVEPDTGDSLCDSEELDVGPAALEPPHYLVELEPKAKPDTGNWGYNEESRETQLGSGGVVKVEVNVGPKVLQAGDIHFLVELEPEVEPISGEGQSGCNKEIQCSGSSITPAFRSPNTNNQNNICVKHVDEQNCSKLNDGKITIRPYKCTKCNKSFVRADNLKSHIQTHSEIKPYKCTVCDKTFCRVFNLKCHMQTHADSKPYKCTDCDKSFTFLSKLTSHRLFHTGAKPYKCTECDKSFVSLSKLTSHMYIHTGAKPYKCTECDKRFNQSGHLKDHMHGHTGSKPYKCSKCDKTFTRPSYLKCHFMRIHSGVNPFSE